MSQIQTNRKQLHSAHQKIIHFSLEIFKNYFSFSNKSWKVKSNRCRREIRDSFQLVLMVTFPMGHQKKLARVCHFQVVYIAQMKQSKKPQTTRNPCNLFQQEQKKMSRKIQLRSCKENSSIIHCNLHCTRLQNRALALPPVLRGFRQVTLPRLFFQTFSSLGFDFSI